MPTNLSMIMLRQIEPAFQMLMTVIETCPGDTWTGTDGNVPVWQHLVHTIYYLDKWIRKPGEPFNPPAFITKDVVNLAAPSEPAIAPGQVGRYLREVICRCHLLLEAADDAELLEEAEIYGGTHTLMDLILSQIRHSSYHIGCISAIFYRFDDASLYWIGYRRADAVHMKVAQSNSVPVKIGNAG